MYTCRISLEWFALSKERAKIGRQQTNRRKAKKNTSNKNGVTRPCKMLFNVHVKACNVK